MIGQPNLEFTVDRDQAARYGLNVADVQDAIETAVGGKAVSQVLQGEQRYDLVVRYQTPYRNTKEAIENIRLLAPSGERVSLAQLCTRQGAGRRVGNLSRGELALRGHQVQRAGARPGQHGGRSHRQGGQAGEAAGGLPHRLGGRIREPEAIAARLLLVVPLTILVICMILYTMFKSFKWVLLILANVAMAPIGGLLALLITGTHFSVSSGVGFLALFGVAVQTGVIMLEYINQLRARGHTVRDAAMEGSVLRLRPIMMTMLVASFGLLPAALSRGIGSDSQRPFAIVIVGGLIAALILGDLPAADAVCLGGRR